MRLLVLVVLLACATPASAAWRLDPGFADHGRFERSGDRWRDLKGVVADAGGGALVWSRLRLQRLT
ncbi:MAG TPA: hypothetical protein VNT55_16355, partial [Baekduia sp.]|nr:hypothetical protein [Baekduia sp.]